MKAMTLIPTNGLAKALTIVLVTAGVTLAVNNSGAADAPDTAEGKYLYMMSNNVSDGQNSVVAYLRTHDGRLVRHPRGPFSSRGTGIDNSTNGKLGPNDNDTPLIVNRDGSLLFALNGHSNSIAVFTIHPDGALSHVDGSPFGSEGVGPVSLAMSGDMLLVANRNEDPHQIEALRGAAHANYASFRVSPQGRLDFVSRIELKDGQKPTQILVSSRDPNIAFGNDFQVDADFDGEGGVSKLFGETQQVRGRLHAFRVDARKGLRETDVQGLVETADPVPEVPTVPLGIWDHPSRNLVYVGLVTRNQLGVYRYSDEGKLSFVSAVPNSGQDICWVRVNAKGTRLYAVNNLPREDEGDAAGTITVFDISGDKAEKPVEMGRLELPLPLGTFTNNRTGRQPQSTPFQLTLDKDGRFLYVINQRIDQTPANKNNLGNVLHVLSVADDGTLSMVASRHLDEDGVEFRARPQGVVSLDLPVTQLTSK